jgi:hypothetical protein
VYAEVRWLRAENERLRGNDKFEPVDGLADWLKHMQELNRTLAHIPEMAAHIDNLKKWENAVRSYGHAQRQQQLQEAVAAAHAAFEAIPIGYPLQQNGRTIDHTLLNEAKRLCEIAVSDTSTDRTWHEAMADRVLQLKIGGAKNLSCDAVLGLIAFVRDGEGSVAVTSPDREGK